MALALAATSSLCAQQWSQILTPTQPAAANCAAMAYHHATERTVWFGGQSQLTGWPIPFFHETWVFDGRGWQQASPTTQPSPRSFHAMVGSEWSSQSHVYLFGGGAADGSPLSDLWQWNGTTWQDLAVSPVCPARCNPAIASYGSGLWIFGGYDPVTGDNLNDTWLFGSGGWTQTADGPMARHGARAVEGDGLTITMHGSESTTGILSDPTPLDRNQEGALHQDLRELPIARHVGRDVQ